MLSAEVWGNAERLLQPCILISAFNIQHSALQVAGVAVSPYTDM
jgi:hypothetical protein